MNESEKGKRDKLGRLFEAATKRFGEDGYSETSMESIAEEAGVSKGTLYYYFDSKEELFIELLLDWVKKFERFREDGIVEDTPMKKLIHLHDEMMEVIGEMGSLGKLMLEFWANASRKKELEKILNDTIEKYRKTVARIIERGNEQDVFRDVDPWEASSALVAAYDGLWFHWLLAPDSFEVEEAGNQLITNYLHGLAKEKLDDELLNVAN